MEHLVGCESLTSDVLNSAFKSRERILSQIGHTGNTNVDSNEYVCDKYLHLVGIASVILVVDGQIRQFF
jgi:hypothetical protein